MSRTSGVAPELAAVEERELDRFAMSAEQESYATRQNLSPAEMPAIKKSGGRLMFSKRPPGMVLVVRLASGYAEACPPCLSCPWAACCPALPSGVPAAVVAADFAAVSAVPADVSARAARAAGSQAAQGWSCSAAYWPAGHCRTCLDHGLPTDSRVDCLEAAGRWYWRRLADSDYSGRRSA